MTRTILDSHRHAAARFLTTRWEDVHRARGNSAAARQSLSELCERYYSPVYAFVCATTRNDQEARDWTHSFFAKLLEGNSLERLQPGQSRFRSYLLGAVKHFLADEREKARAAKRGGAVQHQSLIGNDGSAIEIADDQPLPQDAYFDRQWALAILDQALSQLEDELAATPAGKYFQSLKPGLVGAGFEQSQLELARTMDMSEEALKGTLHRWRKRFREIVKSMIASTLTREGELDEELRYLMQCLALPS